MKRLVVLMLGLALLGSPITTTAQPPNRGKVFPTGRMVPVEGLEGIDLAVGVFNPVRGEVAWNHLRNVKLQDMPVNPPPPDGMEYIMVRVIGLWHSGPSTFFSFIDSWAETPDGKKLEQAVTPTDIVETELRGAYPAWGIVVGPKNPTVESWMAFLVPKGVSPVFLNIDVAGSKIWFSIE